MAVTLFHHPYSRAATALWMLEEVGVPYTLSFVDLYKGAQKQPGYTAHNPMGKVPTLLDGDTVVTETGAIGVYLADRYALGRLAPALDDPTRGTYLRWMFYGPSVVEPGCMAQAAGWAYRDGSAGWGRYDTMLDTLEAAIGEGPWLLGDTFSMADIGLGGTIRFMLQFKMLEPREAFTAYAARLEARPAQQRAAAANQAVVEAQGLGR